MLLTLCFVIYFALCHFIVMKILISNPARIKFKGHRMILINLLRKHGSNYLIKIVRSRLSLFIVHAYKTLQAGFAL